MQTFFIKLYHLISKNRVIALVGTLLFLLALVFFATKIKFEEDITRIIPQNEKSDITAKVLQQLNFSDKITVIIEKEKNGTIDDLTETAYTLLDSLEQLNGYISEIQGRVNEENIQETFDFVYANLPLFLDATDYKNIQNKLTKDSIASQVDKNYKTLLSPTGIVAKDFILNDPLGISFIALKKLQQLNLGDDFYLHDGFVITKDNSKILLFITPKLAGTETEKNTLFVAKLDSIKTNINRSFVSKTNVDFFGSTLIAVANAKQIKHDILSTVMISISVLILIFIFFYRKFYIPLIIFIPTIFGALLATASLYFLKGTISAISISIGAILLGVTVDYSLHILTHYKHNSNIQALYAEITKPIIMSSATTAISFLCLLFVNSEALKDLGVFAAISVVFSAVVALVLIPHLYKSNQQIHVKKTILDKIGAYPFHQNKIVIGICLLVILSSLFVFNKVTFNNDLAALNFVPKEIKAAEAKLESTTNLTSKSIYLASYGNSIDEVLTKNNELFAKLNQYKTEQKILKFSSIGGLVLSKEEQLQKIENWNSFWRENSKEKLQKTLIEEGDKLGFKPTTHTSFYNLLNYSFEPIPFSDYEAIDAFFLKEFVSQKDNFYTITSLVKVSNSQRDSFVNDIEKSSEYIAIDRKHMNETFLGKLKNDFGSLINYSLLAIVFILIIFFRRIELMLISVIPIVVTGIVTAGMIVWFGLELNIFSTIVCTLIFGIGVDFSIFMTSALQNEYTTGKNNLATYRTSILLAVITTVLSIGTLIFAKHPALKSISSVSLIGIFSAVIITFVFYPLLFKIAFTNRVKKGKSPISLRLLLHSTLSFIYYGLGGFMFSVFGQIMMKLLPVNKTIKMQWFRKAMSKFMKSVLYTNPFATKRIINKNNEDFSKPAIIIANHTSFLDTLAVGMLSHKIIFLVNDWVYNSPIFGRAVKLAGFYPVSSGLEDGITHLKEKIDEGYSLMIFPEGTRSETNYINRFHKGAFYLAEQFNLDILPVYIHGNSETLPKGDHIIYDENINVIIGNRIAISDTSFGLDYSQRTKSINKYFRAEFTAIRKEYEDADYFKNKLFLSFLYKEQQIISQVKEDFKVNKSLYFNLNKYIASDAKILHIANDFGQIDCLLALQEPKRKIQTFIFDEEKRNVASCNYLVKKRNISYVNTISETNNNVNTVLISSFSEAIFSLEENANVSKVILLNSPELTEYFVKQGFKLAQQESSILILNR
jgi:uncharacterized protein